MLYSTQHLVYERIHSKHLQIFEILHNQMKAFQILVGLILSPLLVFIGFTLTNLTDKGIWIPVFFISIPFIAWNLKANGYNKIALGMYIMLIPLSILLVISLIISSLH